MKYKYKRNQIFGKRLKVPKEILEKIYDQELSFEEYIQYELEDKIPIDCIQWKERDIIKILGVEKSKTFDWELTKVDYHFIRSALLDIDPQTEDINTALYTVVSNRFKPSEYPPKMKELYPDRIIEINENDSEQTQKIKKQFNEGDLTPAEIIYHWDLLKDKDLSVCLKTYLKNRFDDPNDITDSNIKDFMSKYGDLAKLIVLYGDATIFIKEFSSMPDEKEQFEYIKMFTDSILPRPHYYQQYDYGSNSRAFRTLKPDECKIIFKYSSLDDYLKVCGGQVLIEELKDYPDGYIFDVGISLENLISPGVMDFIKDYGLKNVVEFDNENGNILTANECRLMNQISMKSFCSAKTVEDIIHYKLVNDLNNGERIPKEHFYEIMKIYFMNRYNPDEMETNIPDEHKRFDYSSIKGVFREKYPELFISKSAPIELQKKFYSKSLTLESFASLSDEEKKYLEGKRIGMFVNSPRIRMFNLDTHYDEEISFCDFLSQKTDFQGFCDFISEYYSVLNDTYMIHGYYSSDEPIEQIKKKIHRDLEDVLLTTDNPYPKHIPIEFRKEHPEFFLDEKDLDKLTDEEAELLKNAFYSKNITGEFLKLNVKCIDCLENIDPRLVFHRIPVDRGTEDLVEILKNEFGIRGLCEVMMLYGDYINKVKENKGSLNNFYYKKGMSKDEILDRLDGYIKKEILEGNIKYDENAPTHFKNNNPTFFLEENIPEDIKKKFYNREFTIDDFRNPKLMKMFGSTNIACGLPLEFSWIIPLYSKLEDGVEANKKRLAIMLSYQYIPDSKLREEFVDFIQKSKSDINENNAIEVAKVFQRLAVSNSLEMRTFRSALAEQIIKSDKPMESLNKIEDMFIKNNIPTVGKVYSCFEILHPDFGDIRFAAGTSPTLAKSSPLGKKVIVFSDLIKTSFGSNNRSVNDYIRNIEFGSKMFEQIKSKQFEFESLDEESKEELKIFRNHLMTLYNNSLKAKKEHKNFKNTENVATDILELAKLLSPNGTLDYKIGDRVIRMFCGFAGIDTLEEAKEYIDTKVRSADVRNREAAKKPMVLEPGDFVEGVRSGVLSLESILQNGCVAGEFLGAMQRSDATPLSADFSRITVANGTNADKLQKTEAHSYGTLWIVLKNDERFKVTKTEEESFDQKWDKTKTETYFAHACGEGHYGIRTGIASTEINYIMVNDYNPRIGFEIAKNGFYIPVVNVKGEVLFTPEDYDKLRSKMSGLSYYGITKYEISSNLHGPGIDETKAEIMDDVAPTNDQNNSIKNAIKNALIESGISNVSYEFSPDLSDGICEVYSTGSTSRNTNVPNDCDFDYLIKIDNGIYLDKQKLEELKTSLKRKLHLGDGFGGKICGESKNGEKKAEIEISFCPRTDKIDFSTDIALSDKLEAIKEQYPDSYLDVLANIVFAKKFFKEIHAYKSLKSDNTQGGLGGIGIENWVLQHGGSFIDAARDFVEMAEKAEESFDEFSKIYQVFDLGKNHYSEKEDSDRINYPHDNFVGDFGKMGHEGFEKIVEALKQYVYKLDNPEYQTEKVL